MKAINLILGIGTAIILSALIILGIKAFYPQPQYPTLPFAESSPNLITSCATSDTSCRALQLAEAQSSDQQQQAYENQIQIYNRNLFIIANILGVVIFAFCFWLLFATAISARSVPIGGMIAGLWSIMYGYVVGSHSVNDQLKFFIGLVIAVLIIGGSMWLIHRYTKKIK